MEDNSNFSQLACEFDLCIYNDNAKCILGQTTINSIGMCDECIIVSMDQTVLSSLKMKQLKKYLKDNF